MNLPTFFFGHRPTATLENLRFVQLLRRTGGFQVCLDDAAAGDPVRLEKVVRDVGAVVSLSPAGDPDADWATYDAAVRARCAAAFFYDRRLGSPFRPFPSGIVHGYDRDRLVKAHDYDEVTVRFGQFRRMAGTQRAARAALPLDAERRPVGLLVEKGDIAAAAAAALERSGLPVRALQWPPAADGNSLAALLSCDWLVTGAVGTPAAFLCGVGLPTLWLRPAGAHTRDLPAGGTLEFTDANDVEAQVLTRAAQIDAAPAFLTDDELEDLLRARSRRPERVFVSYSKRDLGTGRTVSTSLRERFRSVFDYRQAGTIPPGADWSQKVDEELRHASVGVLLLSKHYQASDECMREARVLLERHAAGEVTVLPILLEDVTDAELRRLQYVRPERSSIEEIVDQFVRRLG